MSKIWAIILAAGESKRMGFPKMLLPFNGMTMLENVLINIYDSEVENVLVVLGADSDSIKPLVDKSSVKYCYNDNYRDGMLSSVKCGLNNLPSDFKAVLIFQGDQPLITSNVINTIIGSYRLSGKGIVIPVHKTKRGHPLLIHRKYLHEIDRLDPLEGLRSLAYKFPGDVQEVEITDSGILRDFDTFDEYKKEINQIQ